jgi:hypothetical protein
LGHSCIECDGMDMHACGRASRNIATQIELVACAGLLFASCN